MKTLKLTILLLTMSMFSTAAISKSLTKKEVVKYNTAMIARMIKVVQPDLKVKKRNQLARALFNTSKKFAVDPKIMIAIISTESSFRNHVVSSTGDLSLAQINTAVWDKEFARLGLDKLNRKLLKKDEVYALNKMGKILSILKQRHASKDSKWYACYHSKTKKYKDLYDSKVQTRLRKIASVTL